MNRTELRHCVLALVAQGDTVESYLANVKRSIWKFRRTDKLPFGPDARALGELATAGFVRAPIQLRFYAPRPVRLTKSGERLLSEWDANYGTVTL